MSVKIIKDYTSRQLEKFYNSDPKRYGKMCEIIGELVFLNMATYIGVSLPNKVDRGCVIAYVENENENEIEILNIKFF